MDKPEFPGITVENLEHTSELKQFLGELWEYGLQFREPTKQWIEENLPIVHGMQPHRSIVESQQYLAYWNPEHIKEKREINPNWGKNKPCQDILKKCVVYCEGFLNNAERRVRIYTGELMDNCIEKGATYVFGYYQNGLFILSDDVEYPAEDLNLLIEYLNSPEYIRSTKNQGGCGVNGTRVLLLNQYDEDPSRRRGKLFYSTDGKRIFAIMVWDEEKLLNPRLGGVFQ